MLPTAVANNTRLQREQQELTVTTSCDSNHCVTLRQSRSSYVLSMTELRQVARKRLVLCVYSAAIANNITSVAAMSRRQMSSMTHPPLLSPPLCVWPLNMTFVFFPEDSARITFPARASFTSHGYGGAKMESIGGIADFSSDGRFWNATKVRTMLKTAQQTRGCIMCSSSGAGAVQRCK